LLVKQTEPLKLIDPVINEATFIGSDTFIHPVEVNVYVKNVEPALMAVTTPAFDMEATVLLLLDQVPLKVDESVVFPPIHKLVALPIVMIGNALMVTVWLGLEIHPVLDFVKVKVALPAPIAVTNPVFDTLAIEELLLDQVPPLEGESCVVLPAHIVCAPSMVATGFALIVIL
jgi:hypothetical protein